MESKKSESYDNTKSVVSQGETGPVLRGLPASPVTRWVLRLLTVVVLSISTYLAWKALRSESVAGCGGGGTWDCERVMESRWSNWLGLPISVPAIFLYATMLVALSFVGPKSSVRLRRWAWSLVAVCAVMAGGAAIWFIGLQWFVIRGFCVYCFTAHIGGMMILAIVLCSRPFALARMMGLTGAGLLGVAVLAAGQILVEPPPTHAIEDYVQDDTGPIEEDDEEPFFMGPIEESSVLEPPAFGDGSRRVSNDESTDVMEPPVHRQASRDDGLQHKVLKPTTPSVHAVPANKPIESSSSPRLPQPSLGPVPDPSDEPSSSDSSESPAEPPKRIISVLGGRAKLNVYQWPTLGSPEATHVLVELFDYTCAHCRTMNQYMKSAKQQFGDQLAVVVLPVPLNAGCNSAITSTSYKHRDACDLARFAIAVWLSEPESFPDYHDWLFQPYQGRSSSEARNKAAEIIGADKLQAQLNGKLVNGYIKQHVGLYKRAGKGTVPAVLATDFTLRGQTTSADSLCRVLEQRLSLTRLGR